MRLAPLFALLIALFLPASAEAARERRARGPWVPDPDRAQLASVTGHGWLLNPIERKWRVRLMAELGFSGVLYHRIQTGLDGTEFDYLNEGGQDNLFPFVRAQAELELWGRLNISLLYQPLNLETDVILLEDHRFDGVDMPAGTPVDIRYGFSFFRLSIWYDFLRSPENELGIGLSAQIRNATLDFTSADGALRSSNRDLGFVPIIKLRGRHTFRDGFFLSTEIDGFYARGRGITGSVNVEPEFEGLIMDAGLRVGTAVRPIGDVYFSLRYIGGGARGTSTSSTPPGDGYVRNFFHTLSASIGVMIR